MGKKRKFFKNGVQHICQISKDGSLLFCTVADRIFLFTLISVYATKHNITISQLCIMFNHFHIQAQADSIEDLQRFLSTVTWSFAYIQNRHFGLSGSVFKRPFLNAPKMHKKVFDNMIYIANNPTAKQAVTSAWDYRWNFLRYAPELNPSTGNVNFTKASRHPYSDEYKEFEASKSMKSIIRRLRHRHRAGKYISYDFFESESFENLSNKEQRQLLDIIINIYNPIDYRPMLMKYGSVQSFCNVLNEVEGSEYDINDDLEKEDYKHYNRMIEIAAEEGYDMRFERCAGVDGYESNWTGTMIPPELREFNTFLYN